MKRKKNTAKNSSTSLKKEEIADIVRQEVAQTVPIAVRQIAIERTEIFSGPIPSPSACKQYEEILPGFTDRAVSIAEKAQNADIESRTRGDRYLLFWRSLSVMLAAGIAIIVIGGAIFLLNQGKDIAGFTVLVGGVATIITAIRKSQSG